MWCAYAFAAVALIGLPPALKPGGEGIIAWIAQTLLQLVLLSIIIVGQNIATAASDERSENTYMDAEAILSEAIEIQKHLSFTRETTSALSSPSRITTPSRSMIAWTVSGSAVEASKRRSAQSWPWQSYETCTPSLAVCRR
jgi:hypothetical protein